MLKKLTEEVTNRFLNIEDNHIFAVVTFLDPRFKGEGFSKTYAFEEAKTIVTRLAGQLYFPEKETRKETVTIEMDSEDRAAAGPSIWDKFDKKKQLI